MLKHARSATWISQDCNKILIGEHVFGVSVPSVSQYKSGCFRSRPKIKIREFLVKEISHKWSLHAGKLIEFVFFPLHLLWFLQVSILVSFVGCAVPPLVFLSYVSLRGFRCSSFTGVTPKASRYLWHEGCMQSVCFDVISICLFIPLGSFTTFYLQSIMFQDL